MQAKLIVDFGNSETRLLVSFVDNEGMKRNIISRLPNKYKIMTFGVEVFKDPLNSFTPDTTYAYTVEGKNICMGLFAEANYMHLEQPTPTLKKYQNETTLWAFPAVYKRANEILDLVLGTDREEVVWDMYICLPAQEKNNGTSKMKELVDKTLNVEFLYPEMSFDIRYKEVNVMPEGFSSLVACAFDMDKTPLDTDLLTGCTLVIDIGEGTTDLCVTKNGRLLSNSLYTIGYGGRNLLRSVRNVVVEEMGLRDQSDAVYEVLTQTGQYKMVNGMGIDITTQLAGLRNELSRKVCTELTKYLENTEFSMNDIENVAIVGGGSIDKGVNSIYRIIADYITNAIEKPDALHEPIAHEVETYDPVNGLQVSVPNDYVRLLNVIGACIFSK